MAMNPMQRKVRNAFLFGFVVALLIGALGIGFMVMQNKKVKEELAAEQEKNQVLLKTVYVASKSLEKDEVVSLMTADVPAQYVPDNAITPSNINEYYMEEDNPDTLAMVTSIPVAEGSILTRDFVAMSQEATTYRMVEYSMITLPSKMVTGDYIDIRLACLGYDSIVLSKVKVEDCTASTIWLSLSELQMQTLNYAIVENYIIEGSKLYATQYANEAQSELNVTYIPDDLVISYIETNITDKDKALSFYYDETTYPETTVEEDRDGVTIRTTTVEAENADEQNTLKENALKFREDILYELRDGRTGYTEEDISNISSGYSTERSNIQAARESLMGDMGY